MEWNVTLRCYVCQAHTFLCSSFQWVFICKENRLKLIPFLLLPLRLHKESLERIYGALHFGNEAARSQTNQSTSFLIIDWCLRNSFSCAVAVKSHSTAIKSKTTLYTLPVCKQLFARKIFQMKETVTSHFNMKSKAWVLAYFKSGKNSIDWLNENIRNIFLCHFQR